MKNLSIFPRFLKGGLLFEDIYPKGKQRKEMLGQWLSSIVLEEIGESYSSIYRARFLLIFTFRVSAS